jgi:hypothetical protein
MADEVAEAERRAWIENRYGPITTQQRTVLFPAQALVSIWVAAVPVLTGIGIGAGPTEHDAIDYLYMDLRDELKLRDIPLI